MSKVVVGMVGGSSVGVSSGVGGGGWWMILCWVSSCRERMKPSEMVLCPILWGINLSHIYAREVRQNFEFNS
jgi:hypothetical protein